MDDYRKQDQGEVWRTEYQDDGLTCREIGKRHGIPENLVYSALKELGVDTSARTRARKLDRAAIVAARAAGQSPKQIAETFKTSINVIYNTLSDMRRTPNTGDTPPAAEMGEMEGCSEVAERY